MTLCARKRCRARRSTAGTPTDTDARDVPFHCENAAALLVKYGPIRCTAPLCYRAPGVAIVVVDAVADEVRLVVLLLQSGH